MLKAIVALGMMTGIGTGTTIALADEPTTDTSASVSDTIDELANTDDVTRIVEIIITAMSSGAMSLMTCVYGFYRWRKIDKNVSSTADKSASAVESYSTTALSIAKSVKESADNVTDLQKAISTCEKSAEEQTEAIKKLTESNTELANKYATIETKLNAILGNQALMAETKEGVSNGTNAKVKSNVKEATADGTGSNGKEES